MSGAWTNEAHLLAAEVASQTNLASPDFAKFFRLAVADVDSDADGLTDFEERALGFNPLSNHAGRNDSLDYQRATNGLSAASTITVSALDPAMTERWSDPGLVAVRRSGGLLPRTVNLAFAGTATAGADYFSSATNTVLIPRGGGYAKCGWSFTRLLMPPTSSRPKP